MPSKNFEEQLWNYIFESQHEYEKEERYLRKKHATQARKEHDAEFREHLKRRLGDLRGKRVLEVGSGSGWRSVAMALDGADVHGIEPVTSGVAASLLRAELYPQILGHVDFTVGVGERLPFPDEAFDMVVSFQVIEHVVDIDASLGEMRRVLKPGGTVYMETGNALFPREEHYRSFWIPGMPKSIGKMYARLIGKDPAHLDHVHFIFRGNILRRMRQAGFSEERDLYRDYVVEKFSSSVVRLAVLRKIIEFGAKLRLNRLMGRIAAASGFYPGLWLIARKQSAE